MAMSSKEAEKRYKEYELYKAGLTQAANKTGTLTQTYDPISGTYTGLKSGYTAPAAAAVLPAVKKPTTPPNGGKGAGAPPAKTGTGSSAPAPAPVAPVIPNVTPLQPPQFGAGPQIGGLPTAPNINPYQMAPEVQAAWQIYQNMLQQRPGEYQSKYQPQMDALLQQYGERGPFKYDLNADMLYQQMKDQYQQNARLSMMDTQGQAAALTGGFGSTYAQQVGQQAYDQQMLQLNNMIPGLYDRKYGEYQDQGNQILQQFGMAGQLENQQYGQYRDQMGDWQTETQMAGDRFDTERGFDYGKYSDETDLAMQKYGIENQDYWKAQDLDFQKTLADRSLFTDKQNKDRDVALQLLANGKMPGADLLASAGLDGNTAELLRSLYQVPTKSSGSGSKKTTTSALNPVTLISTYQAKGTARLDEALEKEVRAGTVTAKDAAAMRQQIITNVPYTNKNMEVVPNENLSKLLAKAPASSADKAAQITKKLPKK